VRQPRTKSTVVASALACVMLVGTLGTLGALGLTGSTAAAGAEHSGPSAAELPQFDHVVTVVFENKREGSIIGNPRAPYFNELAAGGASFTQSYAVTHPSQPNYVALFSGSTHGLTGDTCPHTFRADNEAHELIQAGYTFSGYSEGLPHAGSAVCTKGRYARKHAPWANFPDIPKSAQQPFTSFPSDYSALPDVSWVIPDLCDDMHDCSIAHGDAWLQSQLSAYAEWAKTNNSLLIVTFDEDDRTAGNQIATIFYGAHIAPGDYDEPITHYSVLRTIEDLYGVKHLGHARQATPITDVWN
jgi:phosphatidylinositol-3-phosphatase